MVIANSPRTKLNKSVRFKGLHTTLWILRNY